MAASCGPTSDTASPWASWAQLPFSARSRDQRIPRQSEHKSNPDIRKSVPRRRILLSRSRQTREFAEAFHFAAGGHGAVLLHHGAHLQVLLEDGVDVLDGGATALGDALAAFAVNDVVVAALLVCPGVDDGFDARELAFVDFRVFGKILERTHLREHIHDFFERSHLANLLELIAEVLESEFFLAELALQFGGGFFIDSLFHAFDERHEVAHAENAGDDALGIKTFEGVVFFAEADEFYRRAGDFSDAQRGAATGVAIELGENHAGKAQALVKFA